MKYQNPFKELEKEHEARFALIAPEIPAFLRNSSKDDFDISKNGSSNSPVFPSFT